MKRVLIIDDEAPARAALRGLLREHPNITLTGEAETVDEAVSRLRAGDYDFVFLDIQLGGATAFDLLPWVRPQVHVVFVTAFDHYAIRAFEINALDYLLKPVGADRLAVALRRMKALAPEPPALPPPIAPLKPDDLVYLKTGTGTTRFVCLTSLAAIEAEDNYSTVYLGDGSRLFVRRSMKAWEDALPSTHFVRVHRSSIVNLVRYRGSDRESDETTLLHLEGLAEPVRASFRYLPELRARLLTMGRRL